VVGLAVPPDVQAANVMIATVASAASRFRIGESSSLITGWPV